MNKDKGARYYPGTDEEKILMDAMEKYKLAPLRSDERKQIREDTSKLLIEKGFKRWDPITVRTWFRNNINNAKNPISGNENEINQFSSVEPQRSPIIQNYPVMYPFVQPQPLMTSIPQQYIPAQPPQQFMQPTPFYAPTTFYTPQVMQPIPAQPRQMYQPISKPSPTHYNMERPKKENTPHEQPIQNNQITEQPISQPPSNNQQIIEPPISDPQISEQSSYEAPPVQLNDSIETNSNLPQVEQPASQSIISDQSSIEQPSKIETNQEEQLPSTKPLNDQQTIRLDDTKDLNSGKSSEIFGSDNFFFDMPSFSRPQSVNLMKSSDLKQEPNDTTKIDQQGQIEETSEKVDTEKIFDEKNEPQKDLQNESNTSQNQTNSKSKVKFGFNTNDSIYNIFDDNDFRFKSSSSSGSNSNNNSSSNSANQSQTIKSQQQQQPIMTITPTAQRVPSFNLFKISTPSPTDSDSDFNISETSSSNAALRNDSSTSNYEDYFGNWDENKDNEEEELPDVPTIRDDLTNEDYDNIKFETYQKIQLCNRILRASERKFDSNNEQRLNFQMKMEERFVGLTTILSSKLGIDHVFAYDKTVPEIKFSDHPSLKRQVSRTTKLYNDAELSDSSSSSSEPSRTSSTAKKTGSSDFPISSSSTMTRDSSKEEIKPMQSIFVPKNFIVPKNIDSKLRNFYYGRYKEEGGRIVNEVNFVETSTFVTYNPSLLKNVSEFETLSESTEFDGLVCEPAMVCFSEKTNTHNLCFKNIEINTGFFLPATSITFNLYKTENGNEVNIYVCGDKRIKEFTLSNPSLSSGFSAESSDKEEETKNETNGMSLINTDNFYIGDDFIQSSVIKVWNNELVLGFGSSIAFWDIKQKKSSYYSQNSPKRTTTSSTLRTSINMNTAKRSGIDLQNVSWAKGKESNKSRIIINQMDQISCLEIIHKKNNDDDDDDNGPSFLAVGSYKYPVIYIYNEEHQNIARLISHTMGISCLSSFNDTLLSGSIDMSVKLWNFEKGVTKLCLNYHNDDVTAITYGFFMNKLIVFTGGKDNVIKCWCITDKRSLFEIHLDEKFVPNQLLFLTKNDSATLKIISYYSTDESLDDLSIGVNTIRRCRILTYEF